MVTLKDFTRKLKVPESYNGWNGILKIVKSYAQFACKLDEQIYILLIAQFACKLDDQIYILLILSIKQITKIKRLKHKQLTNNMRLSSKLSN